MPTAAELEEQIRLAVALIDRHLQAVQTRVPTDESAYADAADSDFRVQQLRGSALFRARVASAVGAGAPVLTPVLLAYATHVVGAPDRTSQGAIDRIYRHFIREDLHVQSRGITFGTPAADAANTGDGEILRLNVDEEGFALENQFLDAKTATCVSDAQSGALPHEESWEIRTGPRGRDSLELDGSGLARRDFRALTSKQSLLGNPSFSSYSFATAPTTGSPSTGVSGDSITDWDVETITAAQLDVDVFAKELFGEATPTSLRFLGTNKITQKLSTRRVRLNLARPYHLELWVRRESSADGNLELSLGSNTKVVDVTTLSNADWNKVRLDLDKNLWPAAFNADEAAVVVEWKDRTTGTLALDEVVLAPFRAMDGSFYVVSGGLTRFLLDDRYTWSDSLANGDAKIQHHLWRVFGRYFPHVANATQVTASGARTLTFSASARTVTASSGSFVTDGYVVGMRLLVAGTSSNNGTYRIEAVTATVITVVEGVGDEPFTDEGPLDATATLDATAWIYDPAAA